MRAETAVIPQITVIGNAEWRRAAVLRIGEAAAIKRN